MCGGFSLIAGKNTIRKRFNAELPEISFTPNYNARPGQHLPVILNTAPHKIIMAFWGYLPHWAVEKLLTHPLDSRSASPLKRVINARTESLAQKPFFRDSFMLRRCLIPTDGFYEWKKTPKGKQPYRILLRSGEPFSFAGIWDECTDNLGEIMPAFAIITVDANREMMKIHDRMPAILLPEEEKTWLSPDLSAHHALRILKPFPAGLLKIYPVSKLVNSPAQNNPEVIRQSNGGQGGT